MRSVQLFLRFLTKKDYLFELKAAKRVFRAVHKHPTPGVPHSKPRLAGSNGKPANKAEVQRLSREYLEIRNRQMAAKAFLA